MFERKNRRFFEAVKLLHNISLWHPSQGRKIFGSELNYNHTFNPKDTTTDTRKWTYTWYVRDASGNVMATYKQSSPNDDNKEVFALTENIV